MEQKHLARLNELAKLAKERPLTAEETAERAELRREYLATFRAAFQQQLDSLFENDVVDITAEIRVMEKMMASEGLAGTNDFK